MAGEDCILFADTMMYLHFPAMEELNLCRFLGAERIKLIIPMVVVQELERHKDSHKNQRVKDRAREALKKIESAVVGDEVFGPNIAAEFLNSDVGEVLRAHGLDSHSNDNRLVAAARHYADSLALNPSTRVVVLSQNTGVRLTCHALKIDCAKLDESLQLPEEMSDAEKELRDVKCELVRLKNARPKLCVVFAVPEESVQYAKFKIRNVPKRSESVIGSEVATLQKRFPELNHPSPESDPVTRAEDRRIIISAIGDEKDLHDIPVNEYVRYNADRMKFFDRYRNYLQQLNLYEREEGLTIRFQFEIRNDGTAVAEDVDILLHFPDGFELKTEEQLRTHPRRPSDPRTPRTYMEVTHDSMKSIQHRLDPSILMPRVPNLNVSFFRIEKSNSFNVSDYFRSIKHGVPIALPLMYAVFDSYESANSFSCTFELRPANLVQAVLGELHFIVEKE